MLVRSFKFVLRRGVMQKGDWCIIGAGTAWSFLGIFIKTLSGYGFSSMQIVSMRATIAAFLLVLIFLFTNIQAFKIKIKDIWLFVGMALFSILISNGCSFAAMQESGITVAIILLYTSPVFVTLMAAVFFKEKLTKLKMFSLFLALLGCVLVSGYGQNSADMSISFVGLMLGLASAFGYAMYSILGRVAIDRGYSGMTIVLYTFVFAASGGWLLIDQSAIYDLLVSWEVGVIAIALSVVSTIVPYFLYSRGLATVEASKASIMACVEPAIAIFWGVVIYSEPFTMPIATGIFTIFCAILLLNYKKA